MLLNQRVILIVCKSVIVCKFRTPAPGRVHVLALLCALPYSCVPFSPGEQMRLQCCVHTRYGTSLLKRHSVKPSTTCMSPQGEQWCSCLSIPPARTGLFAARAARARASVLRPDAQLQASEYAGAAPAPRGASAIHHLVQPGAGHGRQVGIAPVWLSAAVSSCQVSCARVAGTHLHGVAWLAKAVVLSARLGTWHGDTQNDR